MTIPAAEPDPHACESASGDCAVVGEANGAAAGRGEVRLVDAEHDGPRVVPELEGAHATGELGGVGASARRLRLAPPVQLELVAVGERPAPEAVWGSLPERSRQTVLILLARLIDSGAVEQEGV
ncbi:MAG TPA: hypothetical protein VLV25_06365 [Steroidobacteraceae bacterium]|nr:hypothetical protein [Steroidobacteraceae bacterium]